MQKMSERRVLQLDGIRGLAIFLVICWHYVVAPNVAQSHDALTRLISRLGLLTWSGVDLFFVLSGFLIGGILVDAKDAREYFKPFYIRRSFRILPVYLILCVLGIWVATASPVAERILGKPMPLFLYATFTQNVWLAHHPWDVLLSQTWSLAVEEQFYLTLPIVVRFVPRRKLPAVIAAFGITCALGRAFLYLRHGSSWGTAAYVLTFCRGDALLVGVLAALVVRAPRLRRLLMERVWILRSAFLCFGGGIAVFVAKTWTMETRPMSTLGYTWLALFYGTLLMIAVLRADGWWARFLRWPLVRLLGNRAYCLYLVHVATLSFSTWLMGAQNGSGWSWTAALLALGLALGLSEISWRVLESKMIALGHRLARSVSLEAPLPADRNGGSSGSDRRVHGWPS